jgi:hypothetical protein
MSKTYETELNNTVTVLTYNGNATIFFNDDNYHFTWNAPENLEDYDGACESFIDDLTTEVLCNITDTEANEYITKTLERHYTNEFNWEY